MKCLYFIVVTPCRCTFLVFGIPIDFTSSPPPPQKKDKTNALTCIIIFILDLYFICDNRIEFLAPKNIYIVMYYNFFMWVLYP